MLVIILLDYANYVFNSLVTCGCLWFSLSMVANIKFCST